MSGPPAASSADTVRLVRRLAGARAVSQIGSNTIALAVTVLVFQRTGSALWLAMISLTATAALLLSAPMAGRLADRPDRRRLLWQCELAALPFYAALAVCREPWQVMICLTGSMVMLSPFGPAVGALLASSVPQDRQAWANGRLAAAENTGQILGMGGGGLLVATGSMPLAAVVGISGLAVSAWLIASAPAAPAAAVTDARPGPADHVSAWAGLKLAASQPLVMPLLAAGFIVVSARIFSMVAEAPFVFATGAGAAGLGALSAIWSVGMLGGSVIAGRFVRSGQELRWMLSARTVMAAGFLILAAVCVFPVGLLVYAIGGAAGSCSGVALRVLLARVIDHRIMGRTLAALGATHQLAMFTSTLLAGVLIDAHGPASAYLVAGFGVALATVPLMKLRRMLASGKYHHDTDPMSSSADHEEAEGSAVAPRPAARRSLPRKLAAAGVFVGGLVGSATLFLNMWFSCGFMASSSSGVACDHGHWESWGWWVIISPLAAGIMITWMLLARRATPPQP